MNIRLGLVVLLMTPLLLPGCSYVVYCPEGASCEPSQYPFGSPTVSASPATPPSGGSPAQAAPSPQRKSDFAPTVLALPEKPATIPAPAVVKTGGWNPWWAKKQNLSASSFAQALANDDRKILRVPAETYIREIGNLGIPIPQDRAMLAEWLDPEKNNRVTVAACTKEMLSRHHLSRSSKDGSVVDMDWNRKSCYPGEQMLVFRHDDGTFQPFLSLGCGNLLSPKEKTEREAATPQPSPVQSVAPAPAPEAPTRTIGGDICALFTPSELRENHGLLTICLWENTGPATSLAWGVGESRDPSIRKALYRSGSLHQQCEDVVLGLYRMKFDLITKIVVNNSTGYTVMPTNSRDSTELRVPVCNGRATVAIPKNAMSENWFVTLRSATGRLGYAPDDPARHPFTKPAGWGPNGSYSELGYGFLLKNWRGTRLNTKVQ